MWFGTFCPLKVVKSREPVKNLTLFYTLLQITIHEFGASWNRRSSKKAISVCALFCVRGHSEVCSISSTEVLLLKASYLNISCTWTISSCLLPLFCQNESFAELFTNHVPRDFSLACELARPNPCKEKVPGNVVDYSYENEYRLQVHFRTNQTHFQRKDERLVLKQRHKVTRKWRFVWS